MHLGHGAFRWDLGDPLGIALRDAQVAVAHTPVEGSILSFKTAFVRSLTTVPVPRTLHARSIFGPKQDGEVRLYPFAKQPVQVKDGLRTELAAEALVGLGRISKTVAQHPLARGHRRRDDLFHMLRPRCEHQRQFRRRRHSLGPRVQDDGTNLFPYVRAPRFPGQDHRDALLPQGFRQPLQLSGLSRTIQTFKSDESASRCGHRLPSYNARPGTPLFSSSVMRAVTFWAEGTLSAKTWPKRGKRPISD